MKTKLSLFLLSLIFACTEPTTRVWTEDDREVLTSYLEASLQSIFDEIIDLSDSAWLYKADPTQWSVAEIVEHLIVHDELFYRELTVLSALEPMPSLPPTSFALDAEILSYREVTSENRGTSPTYLEPLGRWSDKEAATAAYYTVRTRMIHYLKTYEGNLRAYYTKSGRGPTEYRDLHQLMLISIAHTERHLSQIRGLEVRGER